MLEAHFRAIADEGGLPIVVYNVPSRTGANVEADTFLRLAEHPRVVAVKEASGNIEQIAVICRDRPRDVAVLAGDDAATLAVLAMGGDGVISVAGNEIPGEMSALVAAALAGDFDGARRIHERWLPLFRANFQGAPNPVPAKAAMLAMGLLERDAMRAPLLPLDDGAARATHGAAPDARPRRPRAAARPSRQPPARRRRDGARHRLVRCRRRRPPRSSTSSTRARAARPSRTRPSPGGWRADPDVKAAILARFRDRATATWDLGGVLRFRDRVGLPPKDLLDGRAARAALDAGRPWRIVPAARPSGRASTSLRASSSCRRRS